MPNRFSTVAIHAGEGTDPATGAHNTPIYQTATFAFESGEALSAAIEQPFDNFFYSRSGNPTTAALETKLAALEGTEAALVTSSGMAAVTIAVIICAKQGDHIIVDSDLFVVSRIFFMEDCAAMGIEVSFADVRDGEALAAALRQNTVALFTETLTNPCCFFADLPTLRDFCGAHNLRLVVDNTFLSPYLLRPTELGADLVLHSATKFIGGHGDTVAGALAGSADDMLRARMKLDSFGQCPSPFNSWLIMRGVRTLPMRMRQHSENALALAEFLAEHPKVEWARYPGLAGHPQHEVAAELMPDGFGGMMAVKVVDGRAGMYRFVNGFDLFDIGVSLGDLHTLIYPKPKNGDLVRVSVGCEDVADIIGEFERVLDGV